MQENKHLKVLVKKLYKQIIFVGRDYPAGLNHVRKRAKEEFFKRKDLQDEDEIKVTKHIKFLQDLILFF
jgi:hypothetical protein